MSSVVIAGDVAGSITLQAPSSAGSTVLTLPTTSATLITDSSGILNIGSGQIYKDASGNVGIGGGGTPSSILHVRTASAAGSGANQGVNISNVGNTRQILLGVDDATSTTWIQGWAPGTGASNLVLQPSAGNVNIGANLGVGGATASTSGTGITFPATQSASSSANTLDDYEEGTWTPVLSFATNGTMTYTASSTNGSYTKIGNVVTCKATITLSAFSAGTAAGQARISLPFNVENSTGPYTGAVYGGVFTTLFPTIAITFFNQIFLTLYGITAVNVVPTILGPGNFTATSTVSFSISYKV